MTVPRPQELPQNVRSYDYATLQRAVSSRSRPRSRRGAASLALTAMVAALGIAPVAEAHGAPPQARHYSSVEYNKSCGPNRALSCVATGGARTAPAS
jgi:ferric-dicitrate binding protein FerR (iron transport regulator)